MTDDPNIAEHEPAIHHREITLPDGRYMIFYTFGEDEDQGEEKDEQREDV